MRTKPSTRIAIAAGAALIGTLCASAADLPVPAAYPGDPETISDAFRVTLPSRTEISLNGLWRSRPIVDGEPEDKVPSDDWGWAKIPGFLSREGVGNFLEDQESFFAPKFAEMIRKSRDFAKTVNERRWYRRTFTMPKEAEGHRVRLRFAHVFTRCAVFVDGASVGEVTWPFGELDITKAARPGAEQTIAFRITCLMPEETLKPSDVFMGVGLTFKASGPVQTIRDQRGLTGDVTLALEPMGPRATFSWGELADLKTVRFVTETEGLDANAAYDVSVRLSPLDGCTGAAKSFEGKGLRVDPAGRLAFTAAWPDVALWDFDKPFNRYRVETELRTADGRRVDEVPAYETGFREVRLSGRDVLINGRPLHLTTLLYWNQGGTAAAVCRSSATAFMRHAKALGFNSFNGNNGFSPASTANHDELMEAADAEGMYMMWAAVPRVMDPPFDRERLWKEEPMQRLFRDWAEKAIRTVRRHPSVILYKMNMNATGYGSDLDPREVGKCVVPADQHERGVRKSAEWSAKLVNEIDPTRPAYNHDSGLLGNFYTANIYLGWAPPQERADWMEDWFERGTKPVNWVEFGTPDVSRFQSFRRPYFIYGSPTYPKVWADEFAAEYFGEGAFLDDAATAAVAADETRLNAIEPRVYQRGGMSGAVNRKRETVDRVMGLFWGETQKGFRGRGLHGVLPWCQGEMVVNKLPRAKTPRPDRYADIKRPGLRPDFFCRTPTGGQYNYLCFSMLEGYSPEEAYDLTPYGEAQRKWSRPCVGFLGDGDVFTTARRNYAPGARVSQRLVLVNDHSDAQTATWTWKALAAGKALASGSGETRVEPGRRADAPFDFVLPSAAGTVELVAEVAFSDGSKTDDRRAFNVVAPVANPRRDVLLYDPKGLTAENFRRLKVPHRVVGLEELDKTGGPIAVGRETLTRELWEHTLLPLVEKGRGVVVFEQTQETLESLGFRVQNRGMRQGFVRYRDERRFPFLADAALANWAGESTLVSPIIGTGLQDRLGRQTQNWAGFAMTRTWRVNNRGCIATVIPEKPQVGDWRPLVDGLFALESSPLLEFRTGRGALVLCQLDVTGRTVADPFADGLVRELLANVCRVDTKYAVPDFLGQQAFRAGFSYGVKCWETGKDLVVSTGAKKPDDLFARVEAGAKVLALGLTAKEVAAWSPVPLAVAETNACSFGRIEKPDAEVLNGLSNADFCWHGQMSFAAFQDKDPAGNAAFRIVRHGKGMIVFWQLPPWAFDIDENPHQRISRRGASRMLARLMVNLGWNTFTNGTGYHKFPMYKDVPEAADDPYDWCNL